MTEREFELWIRIWLGQMALNWGVTNPNERAAMAVRAYREAEKKLAESK